jgi:hypothetical protein
MATNLGKGIFAIVQYAKKEIHNKRVRRVHKQDLIAPDSVQLEIQPANLPNNSVRVISLDEDVASHILISSV